MKRTACHEVRYAKPTINTAQEGIRLREEGFHKPEEASPGSCRGSPGGGQCRGLAAGTSVAFMCMWLLAARRYSPPALGRLSRSSPKDSELEPCRG